MSLELCGPCLKPSVLLVVSLRHWLLLQGMHTTVKAIESLAKELERVQRLKKTKKTKLGFLCTLKRRIKYKFPNADRYGSGAHIKALCCFGKVLHFFSCSPYAKKSRRDSLGKWPFCYMNHSVPCFDILLSEQEIQTAWTWTSVRTQWSVLCSRSLLP